MKWMNKIKQHPYLCVYGILFFLFLLLITNSTTETGEPYPLIPGFFLSIICAGVFSLPFMLVLFLLNLYKGYKSSNVIIHSNKGKGFIHSPETAGSSEEEIYPKSEGLQSFALINQLKQEAPSVSGNEKSSQLQKSLLETSQNSQIDRESYERANSQQIKAFRQAFDLETIEGIQSITPQSVQPWIKSAPGVPSHPVEILSKQASAYQKEHLDLAIECLRKANELRPISGMFYTEDSYLRLVRYLCKAERFDEADKEYTKIQAMFHGESAPYSHEAIAASALSRSFSDAKQLGTDLVEVSWVDVCCETCGKYRGRIFSITGHDKRFPKFPSDFCCRCGLCAYPIIEGVSVPMHSDPEHMVEDAQRPFIDTRTPQEIEAYFEKCLQMKRDPERRTDYMVRERKDHEDYAWIQENLPELMPKTFSGYRRMKTMNTVNFQKLRSKALELGREI